MKNWFALEYTTLAISALLKILGYKFWHHNNFEMITWYVPFHHAVFLRPFREADNPTCHIKLFVLKTEHGLTNQSQRFSTHPTKSKFCISVSFCLFWCKQREIVDESKSFISLFSSWVIWNQKNGNCYLRTNFNMHMHPMDGYYIW